LEKIYGQYAIIKDMENKKYYLIDNTEELEILFSALLFAKELKEAASHYIYVIDNGMYKHRFRYFDNTTLYTDWGESVPLELVYTIRALLDDNKEINHYNFYANNPMNHKYLIDKLNEEEGLYFYFPYHNTDDLYSYITLTYKCTIDHPERFKDGNIYLDSVFIPVINYLDERGILYKTLDARLFSSSPARGYTPKHFGRSVVILLNYFLDNKAFDEITQIIQDSTNDTPFLIDEKPSGQVYYTEKPTFPINMISINKLLEDDIEKIKEKYNLK
jgi:hypothetical protein